MIGAVCDSAAPVVGAVCDSPAGIVVWGEVMHTYVGCASNLIRESSVPGQLSLFFLASLLKCIGDLKNSCAI